MSNQEDAIARELDARKVKYDRQKTVNLQPPWQKKPRKNGGPKCDFYLPRCDLYVEVKGWMTIYAMAQMAWFCRQPINYYILQWTLEDWDCFSNSPLPKGAITGQGRVPLKVRREHQIRELVFFARRCEFLPRDLALVRLQKYINLRIDEYRRWNGRWP